jgi:hypothetical protein
MKAFPRPWRVMSAGPKVGIVDQRGMTVGWINKGSAESANEVADLIVKAVNAMPDI